MISIAGSVLLHQSLHFHISLEYFANTQTIVLVILFLILRPLSWLFCTVQLYSEFICICYLRLADSQRKLSCLLSSVYSLLSPILFILSVTVPSFVGIWHHLNLFAFQSLIVAHVSGLVHLLLFSSIV